MRVLLIILLSVLSPNSKHGIGVAARTTIDRIRSFGYNPETHTVTTNDGYILTIFRITNSSSSFGNGSESHSPARPVVLMMHGLASSADCWVINGPSDALAYNLVDSGYDVWLGNIRGTPQGSSHVTMSARNRKFWRFSWHENGVIDLPATIDYILKETGQVSLHYVGHSQGTTVLFVLLSTQPEYNEKLKTSHLLAPIAYMKNARSQAFRLFSLLGGTYSVLDPLLGDLPGLQQIFVWNLLGYGKCRSPSAYQSFCTLLLSTVSGGYSGYLNKTMYPEIFETYPTSLSVHQAIHFMQLRVSGHFRQYDFGPEGNLQRYNRSSPPDYLVSNINPRFPLQFYYSDYDDFSSKTDVEHFSAILGNKSVNHFIDLPQFTHVDFMWSSNVKDVINRRVLQSMNEAEALLSQHESNLV